MAGPKAGIAGEAAPGARGEGPGTRDGEGVGLLKGGLGFREARTNFKDDIKDVMGICNGSVRGLGLGVWDHERHFRAPQAPGTCGSNCF